MKETNNTNDSVYNIIKESFSLFYPQHKKQFHFILGIILLSGIIDVATFASIIPVIYLINNPLPIQENPMLHFLYNSFNFASTYQFIFFLLLVLATIFTLKNLILLFSAYLQNKFIYTIAFGLIERQMTRFYKREYLNNRETSSVEYTRYLVAAPQEFADNILQPIILLIYEILIVALVVIVLLIYYPMVFLLVFIAIVPVSYLMIKVVRKRLSHLSDTRGKLELESFRLTFENVNAYSDIKLFGKEETFISSIRKQFRMLYDINIEINVYHGIPRRIVEVLVILSICVLYIATSIYIGLSPNKLMLILLAFATAAYRLMPSINEILSNLIKIKTFRYLLQQLAFINENKDLHQELPLKFETKLEWKSIGFTYPDNKKIILTDISFQVDKGDFAVITGESGIGKSTIGKILTGFIRQQHGDYMIDGKQVKHFNQIKNLLGYVTQDFYLLDKTLLENIAFGEQPNEVDRKKLEKVIAACNLNEFVATLPTGLNYRIGEMGTRLSGGQKQRIAIARALYKQAQILVLDEITSALDVDNEVEILNTIYEISKKENLTVILITHRISSLKDYDKLFVLENNSLTLKQ